MKIEVAGEDALLLTFGRTVSPVVLGQVQRATALLDCEAPPWLVDMIPSYASLLILFDPVAIDHLSLRKALRTLLTELAGDELVPGNTVEIPVYYGAEAGPDLERVAHHAGCSPDAVVALHQELEYRVYALGFAPGFAYLGELDSLLATPRLDRPRPRVPRGAVAVADRLTAVYPSATPGGWNLIGLCPLTLFDPNRKPPSLWQVGDRVRFRGIDRDTFLELGGEMP